MGKKTIKGLDYPLKSSGKLRAALKPGNETGHVAVMSPKEFLKHANRLKGTKEDKLLISSFKEGMKDGKKFKALKLLSHNHADGRHRATAAEQLGIKELPVIDYRESGLDEIKGAHAVGDEMKDVKKEIRQERAHGGPVLPLGSEDPNEAFRRLIAWSFAVEPLLKRPHRDDGGRIGYATDGGVEGDVQFAPEELTPNLPTFARQDPQESIRSALETAKNLPAPRPEATLSAYEPTIGEKIYGAVAGLGSERPSPERRRFAEGVSELAGFTPGLGNVMSAEEAKRAGEGGDYGGMALAALGAVPAFGPVEEAVKVAKGLKGSKLAKEAKVATEIGSHPHEIDSRLPTGAKGIEMDVAGGPKIVDYESMKATDPLFAKNVGVTRDYPHAHEDVKGMGHEEAAEHFIDHVKDNLLWLHDQIPENIRGRSSLWYDGGNKIVKDWSKKYGISESSAAGALAALSPQKDWFQNVSLADRVLDTIKGRGDNFYHGYVMTPKMEKFFLNTPSLNKDKYQPMFSLIKGKSLGDIHKMDLPDDEKAILKAMWTRLHDQTERAPHYQLVHPEGTLGEFATNANGSRSKAGWGSLPEIAKAIRAIESGGGRENLNGLMGEKHKVRSFYNNLLAPNSSRGDVTIDTHAVAAGLLRPLSGNDLEVAHNFANYAGKGMPGVAGSAASGIQGTYPLYAEAYRRAAKERGILPRQMQSITWEGVRGLFPDVFKNPANNKVINSIWKQYAEGKLTKNEARQQILDFAGGINAPEWH